MQLRIYDGIGGVEIIIEDDSPGIPQPISRFCIPKEIEAEVAVLLEDKARLEKAREVIGDEAFAWECAAIPGRGLSAYRDRLRDALYSVDAARQAEETRAQ